MYLCPLSCPPQPSRPTSHPTNQPSMQPSRQPSSKPTRPSGQPTTGQSLEWNTFRTLPIWNNNKTSNSIPLNNPHLTSSTTHPLQLTLNYRSICPTLTNPPSPTHPLQPTLFTHSLQPTLPNPHSPTHPLHTPFHRPHQSYWPAIASTLISTVSPSVAATQFSTHPPANQETITST